MNDLKQENPRSLFKQTMWVWFGTIVAIRICYQLDSILFIKKNIMLITAMLLIYAPLTVLWRRKEQLEFFEGSFGEVLKSLGWFFILAIIVFPLIEVGNRFFQSFAFHQHYVGGNYRGIANAVVFQILLVALPEEFFFRGYFQTQLNRVWGTPYRLFGAQVGKSLFFTSFLFALSHSLIQQQWWHFAIFFPSLAFGWLREKTDAITASIFFHALSNIYAFWVALNYR